MTHTVKTLSKLLKKTPNEMVTILANANIKGKSLESDISAKERKILMSSLSGHSCNKSSVMISHKSSAKTSTKSDSIKVKKLETKKVVDEKPACKVNESEQVKIVESKIMAISEEIESDNSRLAEYEQDIKDAKDFENKLKDCQEIKGCLRAVHEECEVFFSDRVIASEVNKGKPKKIIDARKKDIKLVNSKIKAKNKRIKILDNTNNIKEVMLDGNNIFNESEELLEKLGAINIIIRVVKLIQENYGFKVFVVFDHSVLRPKWGLGSEEEIQNEISEATDVSRDFIQFANKNAKDKKHTFADVPMLKRALQYEGFYILSNDKFEDEVDDNPVFKDIVPERILKHKICLNSICVKDLDLYLDLALE